MKSNRDKNEIVVTTIRMQRRTYESMKIMAVLTHLSLSKLMNKAFDAQLAKLKEDIGKI